MQNEDTVNRKPVKGLPLSETGAGLSCSDYKPNTTYIFDPISNSFHEVAARPVMQMWALNVTYMQQSVLMGIVRGPDGVEKYHPVKPILRWYRRCLLLSALDGEVIDNPCDNRGGSFTGPSVAFPTHAWERPMDDMMDRFMQTMDQMPIHFFLHMMHAVEIMGFHHGDPRIALWWNKQYIRMVEAMHVYPESKEQLDTRLGDTREGWLARSDPAISK